MEKVINTIQMVCLNDGQSLFILDFDKKKDELTFRTSRIPEHKQTEKITRNGDNIHTNLYFFNRSYLEHFITINDL